MKLFINVMQITNFVKSKHKHNVYAELDLESAYAIYYTGCNKIPEYFCSVYNVWKISHFY